MQPTKTVDIGKELIVGGRDIIIMAGPCAVEGYEQMRTVAEAVARSGGKVLRGGAFKPRTSPASFRGLGLEGLEILRDVAREFGLLIITEALAVEHIPLVAEYADIIQIGTRNMQHYPLLWAAGETNMPVLLKRGYMATVSEWLLAAEHIASRGNERVVLCERGIRSFDTITRYTLDVNAIAAVKHDTQFPVIADSSHATGRADLVLPVALAAVAAGADGLLIEFHPNPAKALSDSEQSLPLSELELFKKRVEQVANSVGRGVH